MELTSHAKAILKLAEGRAQDLGRSYISAEMVEWAVLMLPGGTLKDILGDQGLLEDATRLLRELTASPALVTPSNTARDRDGNLLGYFVESDEGVRMVDHHGEIVKKDASGEYAPLEVP